MRRVDRLLLKIQDAKRLDENTLCYALVVPAACAGEPKDSPNYNKWAVLAYFNKGTFGSTGEMIDTLYFDTQAEAMQAAEEIEEVHAPTGNRVKSQEPYFITFAEPDE